jgi:hypothetical protein
LASGEHSIGVYLLSKLLLKAVVLLTPRSWFIHALAEACLNVRRQSKTYPFEYEGTEEEFIQEYSGNKEGKMRP